MPVTFACPHCGRRLLVHDELGAMARRCSNCGQMASVPTAQTPGDTRHAAHGDAVNPLAAIESGHLDQFVEFLAEHHHSPEQRKIDAGARWGHVILPPAEVVDLARRYHDKFDLYIEKVASASGKAIRVLLYPRRADRGCLCLVGLALLTHQQAWLREHGSAHAELLRITESPMDGHPVQIDFIGTFQKDARRPSKDKTTPDAVSLAFRERLYTLGWNRQEAEMLYFGVQSKPPDVETAPGTAKAPSARKPPLNPRELALLQHIFACRSGARQVEEALCGAEAVLAAPSPSRVFAAEVCDLLVQHKDAHLADVFNALDMATIPLNDACCKYYRKPEGRFPTLEGPDPRMITLTFALAALAEAGRMIPAEALARKVVDKFMDKCRHGATADKSDEWHIGRWGQVYYTTAAAIMMKEHIERYVWAMPILDAVVVEYHHAEDPLYWRAVAAYKHWLRKPDAPGRITMARQRLAAVVSSVHKAPFDPARLDTIRQYIAHMGAADPHFSPTR